MPASRSCAATASQVLRLKSSSSEISSSSVSAWPASVISAFAFSGSRAGALSSAYSGCIGADVVVVGDACRGPGSRGRARWRCRRASCTALRTCWLSNGGCVTFIRIAERVGGHRLGLHQPERVEDLDVARRRLVGGVDLAGLVGGDRRRGVGAVVDVLDAVEVDRARCPRRRRPTRGRRCAACRSRARRPRSTTSSHGPVPTGAVVRSPRPREAAVHDQRRIVGEVRDDGDVGRGQVEPDRLVVDLLDRAVARAEDLAGLLLLDDGAVVLGHVADELLLALLLDDRRHARRHRVVRHVALAPAGQVEDHVVGGEVVAVGPLHALASFSV